LNKLIYARSLSRPSNQGKTWLVAAISLLMAIPLLISDAGIVRAVTGASLPLPDAVSSKVLPEAKVDVYQRTGEWLAENTAEDALIGVTEVGIMGFYAKRPMLDFLGLLNSDVAQALADRDLNWALAAYRPDYVAITAVNPLFSYDLTADATFQTLYRPVKRFVDDRFWGSPVTVYRRIAPEITDADMLAWSRHEPVLFDEQFALTQARVTRSAVEMPAVPGQLISLEFDWIPAGTQPTDYRLFVHLVGESERIVAQLDQLLLPVEQGGGYTSTWEGGTQYRTRHHLRIPETVLTPDTLELRIGLYEPATSVRLGLGDDTDALFLPWTLDLQADSEGQEPVNFGAQLELSGFAIENKPLIAPGESLAVQLYWRALSEMKRDYKVFVHLVNQNTGEKIAQDDARPGEDDAPTDIWLVGDEHKRRHQLVTSATAPSGIYDIWVGLYEADSGRRLPFLDDVGNPGDDYIRLGPIRIGES
jgi:hypothetical protein